jgi:hypothetical protein
MRRSVVMMKNPLVGPHLWSFTTHLFLLNILAHLRRSIGWLFAPLEGTHVLNTFNVEKHSIVISLECVIPAFFS